MEDNRNAKSRNKNLHLMTSVPRRLYGIPGTLSQASNGSPTPFTRVSITSDRNGQSLQRNTPTDSRPSTTRKPTLAQIRFQAPHETTTLSFTYIPAANTREMHNMSTQEQYYQPPQATLHRPVTYRALSFRYRAVQHTNSEQGRIHTSQKESTALSFLQPSCQIGAVTGQNRTTTLQQGNLQVEVLQDLDQRFFQPWNF